jgi:hypothetical protein
MFSSPDDLTISKRGIQSPKQLFVERWGFLFGVFYIPPSLSSVSGTFANVRPSKIKPVIPS